jgi:uncharacterized protein (TIGR03086 family)
MTANPATEADPRTLLGKSMDQVESLLPAIQPGALDRPTPCAEFDLRTLLRHVLAVLHRIRHVAHHDDPFAVPRLAEEDIPDDGWEAAFRAARTALDEAWADDAVLDRVLTLPWGTMPGRHAAMAYVQEMTVHAWDIAKPTGQTARLDPGLAEVALGVATRVVPAEPRGGHVPFGPVVDVPDTAGPYERLVGWLGRQP